MKSMKRAMRRWKTQRKRNSRAKKFALKNYIRTPEKCIAERVKDIKRNHQILLEDPKPCSCTQCSNKNSWDIKSRKRKMRNGERRSIRNYFRESSYEID